jgi:hypothetical protein
MRNLFTVILLFFITLVSNGQSNGNFDLGSNYFYSTSENSIYRAAPENKKLKQGEFILPGIVHRIIPKIESFGFNNKYILAIQRLNDTSFCWIIDKTQDPLDNGYSDKEGRLLLSNVKSIDSTRFMKIKKRFGIEVHALSYYRQN